MEQTAAFHHCKNGGTFVISTFTASKTTEPAIDKALEVLKKLHANGIDEEVTDLRQELCQGTISSPLRNERPVGRSDDANVLV